MARFASRRRRSCSPWTGSTLVAGGFQPVEAYDILIANLDPTLQRRPAPGKTRRGCWSTSRRATTQEVAALMTRGNDAPDRAGRRGPP